MLAGLKKFRTILVIISSGLDDCSGCVFDDEEIHALAAGILIESRRREFVHVSATVADPPAFDWWHFLFLTNVFGEEESCRFEFFILYSDCEVFSFTTLMIFIPRNFESANIVNLHAGHPGIWKF